MAKRIESQQKAAMREMMREYLKNNDISIKSGTEKGKSVSSQRPGDSGYPVFVWIRILYL